MSLIYFLFLLAVQKVGNEDYIGTMLLKIRRMATSSSGAVGASSSAAGTSSSSARVILN